MRVSCASSLPTPTLWSFIHVYMTFFSLQNPIPWQKNPQMKFTSKAELRNVCKDYYEKHQVASWKQLEGTIYCEYYQ